METNTDTTESARLDDPRIERAFAAAKRSIIVYGALSVLALVAVIAAFGLGHAVSTFMWIRAALLPVVGVVIYRLAHSASRGSRPAFDRLRVIARIMPIAIVGIDLIPGICPPWYATMQAGCMLPIVAVAIITHRGTLRAAFPKSR